MGEVIELFPPRTCFACAHYVAEVSRCFLFDEPIDSELYAAKDCNGYEVEAG